MLRPPHILKPVIFDGVFQHFVEATCGSWPFLSIEGQIVQLKSPAIQIKAVASKVFTESRSAEKKIFLSMGSLGAYTFRITIF